MMMDRNRRCGASITSPEARCAFDMHFVAIQFLKLTNDGSAPRDVTRGVSTDMDGDGWWRSDTKVRKKARDRL